MQYLQLKCIFKIHEKGEVEYDCAIRKAAMRRERWVATSGWKNE